MNERLQDAQSAMSEIVDTILIMTNLGVLFN